MPMDEPDAILVERTLAGEPAAFEELVRRYRRGLVRMALYMLGDADEAESVAQEALTRALDQLSSFERERSFRPWLQGITVNICRNTIRERARHATPTLPEALAELPDRDGQRQGVLSGILRREINDAALRAIGQLPAPMREAFVLHFLEELDYAAISQITGLAPGTLRVRAHRARALLRQSLGSVVDTWLRQGEGGPLP
jgi:RNA polymerase sigma-70 factor (ECF subfamily)